jgi:two-component system, chemotaxis family, response regulator Rcp1
MSRILLVEDNPADAFLVQEAFREIGGKHVIEVATDGEQALHRLSNNSAPRPDVIFLDLNLPIKTGHDVLQTLKHTPGLKRIPVIVLTSSEHTSDVIQAYDNYVNAYVQKPHGLDEYFTLFSRLEHFWMRSVKLPTSDMLT